MAATNLNITQKQQMLQDHWTRGELGPLWTHYPALNWPDVELLAVFQCCSVLLGLGCSNLEANLLANMELLQSDLVVSF